MFRRATILLLLALGWATAQSLVVYTSVDEENATRILSAFEDETGIDVQMVFLSSGPALSRIEAEANRPKPTSGSARPARTTFSPRTAD